VLDDHEDNFAIVFAAMGVSVCLHACVVCVRYIVYYDVACGFCFIMMQ